jgi:hypothetical protein
MNTRSEGKGKVMPMNETHMRELMELEQKKVEIERQKLAIQFAAVEVAIDDKIQLQTQKIIDAMSGMTSRAVTSIKEDMLGLETKLSLAISVSKAELKMDISNVRSELHAEIADVRADIHRLEAKLDNHTH